MLPTAIGAVVEGDACAPHTPDSGQRSPVRAVVPMGFAISEFLSFDAARTRESVDYRKKDHYSHNAYTSMSVACPPPIRVAIASGDLNLF